MTPFSKDTFEYTNLSCSTVSSLRIKLPTEKNRGKCSTRYFKKKENIFIYNYTTLLQLFCFTISCQSLSGPNLQVKLCDRHELCTICGFKDILGVSKCIPQWTGTSGVTYLSCTKSQQWAILLIGCEATRCPQDCLLFQGNNLILFQHQALHSYMRG